MSVTKAGAKGWQPRVGVEKSSARPVYKAKHLKNAFLAGYYNGGELADAEAEWQKFATARGIR